MGVLRAAAVAVAAQLVLFALCANASASTECPGDSIQPTAATADDAATALVCDLNAMRVDHGLRPLRWDGRLASAASGMAAEMAARHYVSHVTPDGVDLPSRIEKTGYIPSNAFWSVAENLGWGTTALSTPFATVNGWMDSAPHRANVLDPDLDDVGVGVTPGAISGEVGMVYVADFGARGTSSAATVGTSRARQAQSHHRKRRAHHRKCRAHTRCTRRR